MAFRRWKIVPDCLQFGTAIENMQLVAEYLTIKYTAMSY